MQNGRITPISAAPPTLPPPKEAAGERRRWGAPFLLFLGFFLGLCILFWCHFQIASAYLHDSVRSHLQDLRMIVHVMAFLWMNLRMGTWLQAHQPQGGLLGQPGAHGRYSPQRSGSTHPWPSEERPLHLVAVGISIGTLDLWRGYDTSLPLQVPGNFRSAPWLDRMGWYD
jgi:hypothetical protein